MPNRFQVLSVIVYVDFLVTKTIIFVCHSFEYFTTLLGIWHRRLQLFSVPLFYPQCALYILSFFFIIELYLLRSHESAKLNCFRIRFLQKGDGRLAVPWGSEIWALTFLGLLLKMFGELMFIYAFHFLFFILKVLRKQNECLLQWKENRSCGWEKT